MTSVDVLVICYNSLPHILECVRSYLDSEEVECRVIVVDNASADGAAQSVARLFGTEVTVVQLPENRGYGGAVNAAWEHTSSEWVVVSNADVVADPSMIQEMLAVAATARAAAVSPALTYPDGRQQPGYATESGGLWRRRPEGPAPGEYRVLDDDQYLDGAVMLIRRDAFVSSGGFDERFFFYGEDLALSRALQGTGHRLAHAPSAQGLHARGSDSRARSPEMLRRTTVWLASAKLMNLRDSTASARRRRATTESIRTLALWARELFLGVLGRDGVASGASFQRLLLSEYLGYALLNRDPLARHRMAATGL